MSRYGITRYGTDYYGEGISRDFDAAPFRADCVDYGKVFVTWRKPGGEWGEQRLVRSTVGYPVTVNDGTTLLWQRGGVFSTSYADDTLVAGRVYYYALFVYQTEFGEWRLTGYDEVLITKDYGYTNRLYDRLPDVFKSADFNTLDAAIFVDEDSLLYRFLSVFGFQLDHQRTELDVLRTVLDTRNIPQSLLPALAAEVGVTYEPSIGPRAMRRFVQNAVHLYANKGTRPGIRELANVITSWPASVAIGYNLALDNLDAGPFGGIGRWHSRTGGTVVYRVNDGTDDGPVGDGTINFIPTIGVASNDLDMNRGTKPLERLQYAIPVHPGSTYTVTQRWTSWESAADVSLVMTWLDEHGNEVGLPVVGTPVTVGTVWDDGLVFARAMAPVHALYLEVSVHVELSSPSVPNDLRGCGFLAFIGTDETTAWQCAREVIITLQGEYINEVTHPGENLGVVGTAGWTAGAATTLSIADDAYELASDGTDTSPLALAATETVDLTEGSIYYVSFAYRLAPTSAAVPSGTVITPTVSGTGLNSSDPATPVQVIGSDWTTWGGFGQAVDPTGEPVLSFASMVDGVGVAWPTGVKVQVRHILFTRSSTQVDYFSGSTPSLTQDYIWEGDVGASRSHAYTQRTVRAARLRELVKDSLPPGHCVAFAFARPASTYEDDIFTPGGDELPVNTVGRTISLLWNVEGPGFYLGDSLIV